MKRDGGVRCGASTWSRGSRSSNAKCILPLRWWNNFLSCTSSPFCCPHFSVLLYSTLFSSTLLCNRAQAVSTTALRRAEQSRKTQSKSRAECSVAVAVAPTLLRVAYSILLGACPTSRWIFMACGPSKGKSRVTCDKWPCVCCGLRESYQLVIPHNLGYYHLDRRELSLSMLNSSNELSSSWVALDLFFKLSPW